MPKFLKKVYKVEQPDEVRGLYANWADSYEDEVREAGYATPARVAQALVAAGADTAQPILDFGCGTGLSGAALKQAGFQIIDGVDLTPEMLKVAAAKGLYRNLTPIGPDDAPPPGYTTMAAIGVIGHGAAPLDVLYRLLDALPPGGILGFSFNDHAMGDPAYAQAVPELAQAGQVRVAFEERGDHLPGIDVQSTVYVIEKT